MKIDFLSLRQFSSQAIQQLVTVGVDINKNFSSYENIFSEKHIGIYFKSASTRTRTAFTVGAQKLGAKVVTYGINDLQINTGESLEDTGRVLANFLDVLVVRTNEDIRDLEALADQNSMSVINAMTRCEHPTQVIGDMVALHEALGRFENIHIAYYGEGNNTAAALAIIVSKLRNMKLTLMTPQNYSLPTNFLKECENCCVENGSYIEQRYDSSIIPANVDVVYTTRWETMGVKHADPQWREDFKCFQINQTLMKKIENSSNTQVIFMHDLPAMRGSEVTSEVLDNPNSIVFRQAYHKLTGAMAVYHWIFKNAFSDSASKNSIGCGNL